MREKKTVTHTTQWLWLLLLCAVMIRLFFIWHFGDIDFEPDSYLHFLFSVSTFARLPGSLNWAAGVWPKPLFTLITGLIIWISGVHALWIIKVFNTLIWAGTGLLTYRLARQLKLSPTARLIAVFLMQFSFLGFRSSIGTLTEPLFSLVILAAVVALYARHYTICCVLASLSTLARPEGLVLLPAWAVILWIHYKRRRFWDIVLLVLFPVLWNLWGYLLTGSPLFIVVTGYPLATAPYGHGGWFDYVIGLLQYEPLIFPLALLGGGLSVYKGEYRPLHLLLILYFGFNVVAWRWGLFGTAGILRYFVPIVPWLVIYAATAFDCTKLLLAYQHLARHGLNLLGLQMAFALLILNSHTQGYHEYNTPTVHHALIEAGQWIQAQHPQDYVYSSHPALLYYAGRDFYSSAFVVDSKPLRRDGIVAFESGFGSSELLKYLKRSSLLTEFDNYVLIYDHKLTAVTAHPAMAFGAEDIKPYLRDGWSTPEGWGTWAEGTYSRLSLYLGKPQTMTLTITVIPHFVAGRQQSIKVYYNNTPVGHYEFLEGDQDPQQFSFQVPKSLISGRLDMIKFEYGYAVSPQELGISDDERQLAVGFLEMRITAVP